MKKITTRFSIFILLTVFMTIIFSGCGSDKNKITFNSDYLMINCNTVKQAWIPVIFTSDSPVSEISDLNLKGLNTDVFDVKVEKESMEYLKNQYKNKSINFFSVIVTPKNPDSHDIFEVTNISFNVNGEKISSDLRTPVKYTFVTGNNTENLFETYFPDSFFSSVLAYDETTYKYSFTSDKDILIEDISFENFLDANVESFEINDEEQDLSELKDTVLHKESTITFNLIIKPKNTESTYNEVICDNFIVKFKDASTNSNKIEIFTKKVSFENLGNEDAVHSFIDKYNIG